MGTNFGLQILVFITLKNNDSGTKSIIRDSIYFEVTLRN